MGEASWEAIVVVQARVDGGMSSANGGGENGETWMTRKKHECAGGCEVHKKQ